MKKFITIMLVSLLITSCFSSCTTHSEVSTVSPDIINQTGKVSEIFSQISSNDLLKRTPDSIQNSKSASLIAAYFKQIGIDAYSSDGYYHRYTSPSYTLREEEDVNCVIFTGATTYDLIFGRDFVISNTTKKVHLELNITDNANIKNPKKYIYMPTGKNPQSKIKATNNKFAGYILQGEIIAHPTNISDDENTIIYVNNTVYERLKASVKDKKAETYMTIKAKANVKDESLNNVVGKIVGKSNKEAVVISAPFDGISPFLDSISSSDNPTGVATMLYTANHFALLFKDINPPPFDVYFVGFNSNTTDFAGSKAFVDDIYDFYTNVVNINLDNITGTAPLAMGNSYDEKNPLLRSIEIDFETAKVNTDDSVFPNSDHTSFRKKGYLGVTIGELSDVTKDTTSLGGDSDINLAYCSNIADLIAGYVLNRGKYIFDKTT